MSFTVVHAGRTREVASQSGVFLCVVLFVSRSTRWRLRRYPGRLRCVGQREELFECQLSQASAFRSGSESVFCGGSYTVWSVGVRTGRVGMCARVAAVGS